jgi:hypothetical protein
MRGEKLCGRVRLKWEVEISYDCGVSAFLVVLIDTDAL